MNKNETESPGFEEFELNRFSGEIAEDLGEVDSLMEEIDDTAFDSAGQLAETILCLVLIKIALQRLKRIVEQRKARMERAGNQN